ncbi:MAG: DUF4760 domain-containing protein [Pseudomonadota bacterium]
MNSITPYLGPFAILTSIIVSAAFVRRQIRMNYLLSLRNKSFEYSLYNREALLRARIGVEQKFDNLFEINEPIPMKEIKKIIKEQMKNQKEDSALLSDILTLLAHWENMALAIYSGVADEDVCFEMVAGTMIQHVKIFRNFIDDRRAKNDRAYYYLLKLRRRWEERLTTHARSEFQDVLPAGTTTGAPRIPRSRPISRLR